MKEGATKIELNGFKGFEKRLFSKEERDQILFFINGENLKEKNL